ncbi:GspH/FimT family protein [Variovorax ginsengisoli]|uniref:Type II secretion system protein H n=1 Tax=Variovorax ginsengisoli TaxID=363844 RepID=A0ABT8S691_9BURK|nr:GspH/FimT family protein [Variovorax ginsengisoli]MDN8614624.1 GspH/FimT family protein [Variovorax ginsengisoli]MDO1533794.1 GspH/FimT family protein [Variovorax ginsengisoli]
MPTLPLHLSRSLGRSTGLSTIELVAALAIAAILAALAMPSFGGVIERYRLRRAGEDMTATIYLARAEALRRGGHVTLRKASPPGCVVREVADWSCGWQILVEVPEDGTRRAGGEILQAWPAPEHVKVMFRTAQATSQLSLNRWGRFGNTLGFSVALSPAGNDDKTAAMVLCMSVGGRLQAFQQADKCPD